MVNSKRAGLTKDNWTDVFNESDTSSIGDPRRRAIYSKTVLFVVNFAYLFTYFITGLLRVNTMSALWQEGTYHSLDRTVRYYGPVVSVYICIL